MGIINIHAPAALEGEYQNINKNEDAKTSGKSRGASSNTEDQRLIHRADDSTTEHKRQGCISEG